MPYYDPELAKPARSCWIKIIVIPWSKPAWSAIPFQKRSAFHKTSPEDTVHYKNPLLPETQSEIALPFIVNGQAIGALDVQSTLP